MVSCNLYSNCYRLIVLSILKKSTLKHDISTSMIYSRYGICGLQLFLQIQRVVFNLGLICLHHLLPVLRWIVQMVIGKLQPCPDMGFWSKGTFQAMQDFTLWQHSVLLIIPCDNSNNSNNALLLLICLPIVIWLLPSLSRCTGLCIVYFESSLVLVMV